MPRNFLSVSSQLAQTLRDEISRKTWVDRLPGEQLLATRFHVSRKTVRAAFIELRSAGIIATSNGVGSKIVTKKLKRSKPGTRRIGLLSPEPLESVRQHTLLWVNRLMEMAHHSGYELEVFHGRKYYGVNSARSLQSLTRTNPRDCWVLTRSTASMQRWFQSARIGALVAGSTHQDVILPSVDIDHHALCSHAAIKLFRLGHRRVALLFDRAGHAGDIESEVGFLKACATFNAQDIFPQISKIEISRVSILRELHRLMTMKDPPTGFLLSNSFSYLSVVSYLHSIGKKVPTDVSLISRDEEHFLQFLHPLPARYFCPPKKFAIAVFRAVEGVLHRQSSFYIRTRIMPDFLAGNSIGRISGSSLSIS